MNLKLLAYFIVFSALFFAETSMVYAQVMALNEGIWENKRQDTTIKTLKEALDFLEEKYKVSIAYETKLIEGKAVNKNRVDLESVEVSLQSLLKKYDLIYKKVNDNFYIIQAKESSGKDLNKLDKRSYKIPEDENYLASASLKRISYALGTKTNLSLLIVGKVTSSSGDEIPGVTVKVKGASIGIITDINGSYKLEVPSAESILVFSYIGFQAQEIQVGSKSVINVVLSEDLVSLDEVIVVGYGEQKKATVTGAISTIDGKQLVQTPVANISNALVGRLPGLIAVQQSGEPGNDASKLRIRGIGTLTDGPQAEPLIIVDGVERTNINLLDPNEIESVTILKDASATAVFGVRGANGVILITTKVGKEGKPKISFTTNWAAQSVTKVPDLVNAYEFATLKNEAQKNDFNGNPNDYKPFFTEEDLIKLKDGSDPIYYPNVDWFDEILKKTSYQQQYNLNVSGGTSLARYFVSLGYFDQDGAYKHADFNKDFDANPRYKRYNLRSNFDINVTKRLLASIKLGSQITTSNYPGASTSDIFFRVMSANPLQSPGIVDGKLITGYIDRTLPGSDSNPPLKNILTTGYQNNNSATTNINVGLKYDMGFLVKGLSARGMVAYDSYFFHSVRRPKTIPVYSIYKDVNTGEVGFVQTADEGPFGFSESSDRWRKAYAEAAMEYVGEFKKHTVTGLFLGTVEKIHSPESYYKNGALAKYSVPRGYMGFVGRATYNYGQRYMGEFNMGYNGSENFPEGNRFGFFPSFSLGYALSEEPFFPETRILSYLKIRGSYGEVGNDKIGGERFMYLPSVFHYTSGGGGGYWFGNEGTDRSKYDGAREGKIGNPDVTWERAKKANIGVEVKFLDSRLSFTGDYFTEKRDNILWSLGVIPDFVAAELPTVNLGKVNNKGYELQLEWNDRISELNYWVKANYSFVRNKIIFQDEPPQQHEWLNATGYPVGQQKGLKFAGFFNTDEEILNTPYPGLDGRPLQRGDSRYIDINGDGAINNKDMVPIGYTTLPEVIFGLSAGASYKGFDFSVLFQGADHVSSYLTEMAAWPFDQGWKQAQQWHMDRWTPERYEAGERITYPRLYEFGGVGKNNTARSDFWVRSATYVRLKNAEIGYRFQGPIFSKLGINQVRVFANGVNLMTWTSMKTYDPEAPSGRGEFYPQMRVINSGLNLTF